MTSSREIELRWRRRVRPAYAVALVGFAVVLGSIAIGKSQFQPIHKTAMALAALGFAYSLVVELVNATRMSVEGEVLVVVHGPLPWRGALRMPLTEVRALRCERSSRRLVLHTALGEELVLAEDLPAGELITIDEQIQQRLGIGARG